MYSKNRTPAAPRPDARPTAALLAALEAARPLNCAIAFASVLLGGWLGAHALPRPLLLAGLSAALVMAGGNVLNDLCDIRIDRLVHPARPLPSGRLGAGVARAQAALFLFAGAGAGLALPSPAPVVALCAAGCLVAYNLRLKGVPVAGNLLVSLLCGAAFLYGGFAVGNPLSALVPALFAALYHFGREVLKDIQDLEGDRNAPGVTLPLRWGVRKACVLVTAAYLLLILLTPVPYLLRLYGLPYLLLVLLLDGLLVYVLRDLRMARTPKRLRRLSHLLKAGMLLGLCAIFIDRL